MKKSQIASADVIIAIVVFMMVLSFVFSYILKNTSPEPIEILDAESNLILERLTGSDVFGQERYIIASSGTLNRRRLEEFIYEMSTSTKFYDDLKENLGVRGDYCIHFENENGSIMYLHELIQDKNLTRAFFDENETFPDSIPYYGVGSDKIEINGKPCVTGSFEILEKLSESLIVYPENNTIENLTLNQTVGNESILNNTNTSSNNSTN